MIRHRLTLVSGALLGLLLFCGAPSIEAQGRNQHLDAGPAAPLSQILDRPTDHAITLSVLSQEGAEAYVEWNARPGDYVQKTAAISLQAGVPSEFEIKKLQPNTRYFYRLYTRSRSQEVFRPEAECSFHTQRPSGSAFTFALQGDSHPERQGKMFDAGLYVMTIRNVSKDRPDFYLTLGDDFSIERLINRQMLSQDNVDQVYAHQRGFLGLGGCSSPLFLVNGNHEQADRYLLDGTEANSGVMAARARMRFYPLPAPDRFYTGDVQKVEHVGLLRDYYAWTWATGSSWCWIPTGPRSRREEADFPGT